MKRREFVALVSSAVLSGLWKASAQEVGRSYRLGWLGSTRASFTEPYSRATVNGTELPTFDVQEFSQLLEVFETRSGTGHDALFLPLHSIFHQDHPHLPRGERHVCDAKLGR